MRKSVATGIVLLLLIAGLFAAASQIGWAPGSPSPSPLTTYPVLSASTETPPTIDGIMSAGEWDDAASVSVFNGSYANSTLYVMNDKDTLYIGLSVVDSTFKSGDSMIGNDSLSVRFDNDHNHVHDDGDDRAMTTATKYFDKHFLASGMGWSNPDSQIDGSGAGGTTGGTNFFEISKPLNSGDPDDFNLTMGDTVGACIVYYDDGVAYGIYTVYPVGGNLGSNAQVKYFDILIAPASPVGLLNDLKDYINAMDDDDFSKKNGAKTLCNKIDAILNSLNLTDVDSINEAIDKLTNDILRKTDGEHPPPDWITDPTAQQEVEDMINNIIETLEYIASTLSP